MSFRKVIGAALLGTTLLACTGGTAFAGTDAPKHTYDLPSQDLGTALRAIGRASNSEIIFEASNVQGQQARALSGSYTTKEAVDALLQGTNLIAVERQGTIYIRDRFREASETMNESNGSDIVVTGSRIRGAPTSSRVTTATREEIRDEGIANLGDFARALVQNYSGGQNPGIVGGGQGGSENLTGSTALNLRGLGADATLTLINSHRVAYDAISQGVDITAIPLAAIERVEVVADGASALYGSDAVGGVANIILRRDLSGLTASARLGAATDGGQVTQQYSLTGGQRWAGGGFMVAADYQRATEIIARQRDFTQNMYPTSTLLPRYKQVNLVVAGHQELNDALTLEIDGHFNDRRSPRCITFAQTLDCTTRGNLVSTAVRSYAVSPSLRLRLLSNWEMRLTGTFSRSDTSIETRTYNAGVEASLSRPKYNNTLKSVELNAEGPLFAIGGGDVRLAAGVGYRGTELKVDIKRTINGVTTPQNQFTQRQNIGFAYGEVNIPFVDRQNRMPLVEQLRVTAALRYEDYGRIGSVATPKIGLIYEPHSDVTIKASWGKSFKAPRLYQTGSLSNAYLIPGYVFVPSPSGGRPVLLLGGGNSELKPERATTWTASIGYKPGFLEGFSVDAGYFNIHYRDRVLSPIASEVSALGSDYGGLVTLSPTANQVLDVIAALSGTLQNQTGAAFDPAQVGAIIDNRLQNIARQNVQGVDLSAQYRQSLGQEDTITFKASTTYLKSSRQNAPGQPTIPTAGAIFTPPTWRARGSATWATGPVSFSGIVNYIGGVDDQRFQPVVRVGSFTTVDAILQFKSGRDRGLLGNASVQISIANLLNEKPAAIRYTDPAAPRFDSTNYPSSGRIVAITLSKSL